MEEEKEKKSRRDDQTSFKYGTSANHKRSDEFVSILENNLILRRRLSYPFDKLYEWHLKQS